MTASEKRVFLCTAWMHWVIFQASLQWEIMAIQREWRKQVTFLVESFITLVVSYAKMTRMTDDDDQYG